MRVGETKKKSNFSHTTGFFIILEPRDQEIGEFYSV